MNITHRIGSRERTGEGDANIFLTNKKGSYFSPGTQSDFDGLFSFDTTQNKLFKTLQNIHIDGTPDTLINGLSWAERHTGDAKEKFYLTSNAFIYDIENYDGLVYLTFDCKQLYDENSEKRIYSMSQEKIDNTSAIHIHYSKYLEFTPRYTRHIIVAAIPLNEHEPHIQQEGLWRQIPVPFDAQRGMQDMRWVYDACTVKANGPTRIVITSSANKEKAQEKMRYIIENQELIITANEKYPMQRFNTAEDVERAVVLNALDALVTKKKRHARGVYAGLPWFFQYWMRDEALSAKALLLQGQYALVKEILMRWVNKIAANNMTALEGSSLDSADGPGIVAKRLQELFAELKKNKQLDHFFTLEEATLIHETYMRYASQLTFKQGLVMNGVNETWMDTNPCGDGREGARIEIQTLTLCIYDLLLETGKLLKKKTKEIQTQRDELNKATRDWFYDARGWLIDGFFPDGTVDIRTRPNMFLAWYYQPTILSDEEWKKVFTHALEKLWLSWGGVSSIGYDDPSFQKIHTGVDNKSYHHGDSWFFINNIVAMALFTIDPHEYHDKVLAIHEASKRDLFFKGYAGHISEISNAESQTAVGCRSQAWSAATYLELLTLLRS